MAYTGFNKLGPAVEGYDIGELVACPFSFAPNGSSAPSTTPGTGLRGEIINTVVWTSTGLFTLTVQNMGYELVATTVSVQSVTAAARYAQIGTVSGLAVQIRIVDGSGVVQDIAADANSRIHGCLWLRKKSVSRRRS